MVGFPKININLFLYGGFAFCAFLIIWGTITQDYGLTALGAFLGAILVISVAMKNFRR
jgi:hypothetical protein